MFRRNLYRAAAGLLALLVALYVARATTLRLQALVEPVPVVVARTVIPSYVAITADMVEVVYLPRGVFHNASTPEGRSLHVTFGVRLPTGYDALVRLAHEALSDPMMREYLTPLAADLDGARAAETLDALVERMRASLTVERVSEALSLVRTTMVARSRDSRSGR